MQRPKLSIVVPSFNQGAFLEETLLSIIDQRYPNLELIVIDGGSTDNSIDIIKKYQSDISYWVSEKDRGQSHAINKGIEKATGEWVAWMNSDDCYLPGAFDFVFTKLPWEKYDFIHGLCSSGQQLDERVYRQVKHNYKKGKFHLLLFFHSTQYMVPSQSVFIRKSIIDKAGLLNEKLHYVMDMEWFVRIYSVTHKRLFYHSSICFYRKNENTKSGSSYDAVMEEAREQAKSYLSSLNNWEQIVLKKILNDDLAFKTSIKKRPITIADLISIFFRFPLSAVYNVHFLSLCKKKILSRNI